MTLLKLICTCIEYMLYYGDGYACRTYRDSHDASAFTPHRLNRHRSRIGDSQDSNSNRRGLRMGIIQTVRRGYDTRRAEMREGEPMSSAHPLSFQLFEYFDTFTHLSKQVSDCVGLTSISVGFFIPEPRENSR